jgi:hypothetical protein
MALVENSSSNEIIFVRLRNYGLPNFQYALPSVILAPLSCSILCHITNKTSISIEKYLFSENRQLRLFLSIQIIKILWLNCAKFGAKTGKIKMYFSVLILAYNFWVTQKKIRSFLSKFFNKILQGSSVF